MKQRGEELRQYYRSLLPKPTVQRKPRSGWFWFLRRTRYRVLDGTHRVAAAKANKEGIIPVTVFNPPCSYDTFLPLSVID